MMNRRIKELRIKLGITQQEMATKLGLKRNTIATYEMGKANPSDRTITDICRKFQVNEIWLRTGEGEIFALVSPDEEYFQKLSQLGSNEKQFIHNLIDYFSSAQPAELQAINSFLKKCLPFE